MAQKVTWTIFDHMASDKIADVIDKSGLSLRAIEDGLSGQVSHMRINYIVKHERGPIRLNEFIEICLLCRADPVDVLKEVMQETRKREAQQAIHQRTVLEQKTQQVLKKIGKPEYGLAAYQSSHKLDPESYE